MGIFPTNVATLAGRLWRSATSSSGWKERGNYLKMPEFKVVNCYVSDIQNLDNHKIWDIQMGYGNY
jgi:hypothetical protein